MNSHLPQRLRKPIAAACFGLMLTAFPSFSQDISVIKSNLVVGGTNTFIAHDTNNFFTAVGRVTTPFLSFEETTEIFIQDTSAGIRVKSVPGLFDLETNSAAFQPGVEVTVFGTIKQDSGERSIRPEFYQGTENDYENNIYDFYISDTNPVPVTPTVTTISNLQANGEDFEGSLIRINGVTSDSTEWTYQSDSTHTITDGTASVRFFIDADTDVDGQLPPTNAFDVIGVVGQFTAAPIPSNGYEVIPRSYSDIIQTVGAEPPSLLAPSNVTAIVNLELELFVVGQDRNAGDTLTLTATQSPPASVFTELGNREGVLRWTPTLADVGTTNEVFFEVTDGNETNVASSRVVVRAASGGPGFAWMNEIHYDNTGPDTGEGVELAGQAGLDLSSYYLLFYNGNDGNHYSSNDLSGVIDDEGNGYGALWFPIANIQNGKGNDGTGAADGVALVHVTNGLLQFLSYEGTLSANNGNAAGEASIDLGVSETTDTLAGDSLGLAGAGTNYEDFIWSGPFTATPGDLNGSTQTVGGVVDANVTLSGLDLLPTFPQTNAAFDIQITAVPNSSASALSLTAFYTVDGGATTNSILMFLVGGDLYQTSSQVPGQPDSTTIDYSVCATFSGPGPNSPQYSETNSYTILASATGVVNALINEVRADGAGTETNEFIELIAPAGVDLQNAYIVHYNGSDGSDGELFRFTFPNFVVPDDGITDTNGNALGFVVIGQNDGSVSNQDFTFNSSMQNGPDGLVLYDRDDNILDGISWSGAGDLAVDDPGTVVTSGPPTAANYLHVTVDDSNSDTTLQATNNVRGDPGTGWALAAETPGSINVGQTSGLIDITGGEGPPPPTNQPPVIAGIGNQAIIETNLLTFMVTATDITDNDTITLTASNLPPLATFPEVINATGATGTFTWAIATPVGVYTTTFYAVDKDGVSTQDVIITVNPPPGGGSCSLIISEYIEGSSNNKAIELFNGTAATIDFTAGEYILAGYNNGGAPPAAPTWTVPLTGTLASAETYVIVNATAGDAGLIASANEFGSLFFNGDDAFLLLSGGVTGTVLDSFGQLGTDPGSFWGTGTNSTQNNTLLRKAIIQEGDKTPADAFDPVVEWDFFPIDTFSNLGSHASSCPGGGGGDLDGDGIADAWEAIWCGGDCDPPTDQTGDSDGLSWLEEYILDYDPTVSNVPFEINAAAMGSQNLTFGVTTNTRVYSVDYSFDVRDNGTWTFLETATGSNGVVTVTDPDTITSRVYRVRVHVP